MGIVTPPDNEYSILSKVREWELTEHNLAAKHHGFTKGLEHEAAEKAYKRVAEYIEHGRIRQRKKV